METDRICMNKFGYLFFYFLTVSITRQHLEQSLQGEKRHLWSIAGRHILSDIYWYDLPLIFWYNLVLLPRTNDTDTSNLTACYPLFIISWWQERVTVSYHSPSIFSTVWARIIWWCFLFIKNPPLDIPKWWTVLLLEFGPGDLGRGANMLAAVTSKTTLHAAAARQSIYVLDRPDR